MRRRDRFRIPEGQDGRGQTDGVQRVASGRFAQETILRELGQPLPDDLQVIAAGADQASVGRNHAFESIGCDLEQDRPSMNGISCLGWAGSSWA